MAVRAKGKTFVVDFMVAGERHRVFGFPSTMEAEAWELEARAALKRGLPLPVYAEQKPTKTGVVTIRDHFREVAPLQWASCKARDKQTRAAEHFVEFVGETTEVSEALTGEKINAYVASLQTKGSSGGTINRRLAGVSVLVKYALSMGRVTRKPLLPTQKTTPGRIRWFTKPQAEALLMTTNGWGFAAYAEFFTFLLDTGCRHSEALRLQWSDFAGDFSRVTFRDTKNGLTRSVPLTKRLRDWAKAKATSSKVPFTGITKHGVRGVWDRLRTHYPDFLDDETVSYTFRHTCASWLVQAGVDLIRVKEWMGHTDIKTTLLYSHLAPRHLDELAGVLEARE